MNNILGFVIESFVAVLLLLTICYCVMLNTRLKKLKADEGALKATIRELVAATDNAERAIGGLRRTVDEVKGGLGDQIAAGAQLSEQIGFQLTEGDAMMRRLTRPAVQRPAATPPQGARALAMAAQAFTDRVRGDGLAA